MEGFCPVLDGAGELTTASAGPVYSHPASGTIRTVAINQQVIERICFASPRARFVQSLVPGRTQVMTAGHLPWRSTPMCVVFVAMTLLVAEKRLHGTVDNSMMAWLTR